jgi:hypothetical protein
VFSWVWVGCWAVPDRKDEFPGTGPLQLVVDRGQDDVRVRRWQWADDVREAK